MTRTLMLVALALVGGCDDSATSPGQDAAVADLAVRDFSIVNDPRCPPPPGYFDTGDPCPMAGLSCYYGLEDGLRCVGPEDRWVYCGGQTTCESATEGAICCGPLNGPCENPGAPSSCVCGGNYHVHCAADGGI